MVAHGAVRALAVMRHDRLYHRLVLPDGVGDPVRHAGDAAAVGCDLVAQPAGLISQEGVAGSLVDRLMELLIDVIEEVDLARWRILEPLMYLLDFDAPLGR